jgi:hypothetical protein
MIDWDMIINDPGTAKKLGFKPENKKHLISKLLEKHRFCSKVGEILGVDRGVIIKYAKSQGLPVVKGRDVRRGLHYPGTKQQRILDIDREFIRTHNVREICEYLKVTDCVENRRYIYRVLWENDIPHGKMVNQHG